MKELKIEIPKGYIIDIANSTSDVIKLKPEENINDKLYKVYFIDNYNKIREIDIKYGNLKTQDKGYIFLTKEEAISFRAASRISQLMPQYGGAITKSEWANENMYKYIIYREGDNINADYVSCIDYRYLAFRTEEHRDNFFKNHKDLICDYLML